MIHFFEHIDHLLEEAEWASIIISILIIILLIFFIIVNVIICVCAISARKSLKQIASSHTEKSKQKRA